MPCSYGFWSLLSQIKLRMFRTTNNPMVNIEEINSTVDMFVALLAEMARSSACVFRVARSVIASIFVSSC